MTYPLPSSYAHRSPPPFQHRPPPTRPIPDCPPSLATLALQSPRGYSTQQRKPSPPSFARKAPPARKVPPPPPPRPRPRSEEVIHGSSLRPPLIQGEYHQGKDGKWYNIQDMARASQKFLKERFEEDKLKELSKASAYLSANSMTHSVSNKDDSKDAESKEPVEIIVIYEDSDDDDDDDGDDDTVNHSNTSDKKEPRSIAGDKDKTLRDDDGETVNESSTRGEQEPPRDMVIGNKDKARSDAAAAVDETVHDSTHSEKKESPGGIAAVSYTHLTLPTNREV